MAKFIISSKLLSEKVNMLVKVINVKNTLPILADILFEVRDNNLLLVASDGENRLSTNLNITEGDNTEFTVNARNLAEALRYLPEQPLTITKNADEYRITIQHGAGQFCLPVSDTIDYPLLPEMNGDKTTSLHIPENRLRMSLGRTLFATANDELRPVMNGILFDATQEHLTVVASDGHYLVRDTNADILPDNDKTGSFIMPRKPAAILKALLQASDENVTITFDDHQANVNTTSYDLTFRLIEGHYPNYNSVIPQNNPFTAIVDRKAFMDSLKRVTPFSNISSQVIKVTINNDTITLDAEDYDFNKSATEVMACSYDGDEMTIGFKGSSLLEILDNITAENVAITLASPDRAVLLMPEAQPDNEEVLMLQMPILIY